MLFVPFGRRTGDALGREGGLFERSFAQRKLRVVDVDELFSTWHMAVPE